MAFNISNQRSIFIGYVVCSTILTIIKFQSLYDKSPNFYVLAADFSKGEAILILGNMIAILMYMFGKILQNLIFGELRLIEIEHLYESSWATILGILMSGSAYKNRENSVFLIFIGCGLLFGKLFHMILIDRLDALIQGYYQRNENSIKSILFNRICLSLIVFIRIDISIIKICIDESSINKSSILLIVAFEFFLMMIDLIQATNKFLLNVYELYYLTKYPEDEVWSWKIWIDLSIKVLIGLAKTIMIPSLFIFFVMLNTIPFSLITETFRSLMQLLKSIKIFYRLIKNSRKLNNSLGYPTEEEVNNTDICIICRDDLIFNGTGTARSIPRKLQCGHILHDGCIRSWLEMSNACPTCRKPVIADKKPEDNIIPINDNNNNNNNNAIENGNNIINEMNNELNINNELNVNEQNIIVQARQNNAEEGINHDSDDDYLGSEGSIIELNSLNDIDEIPLVNGPEHFTSTFGLGNRISELEESLGLPTDLDPNGNEYFEVLTNNDDDEKNDDNYSRNSEHIRRLNKFERVIEKIGSLNMNTLQRSNWLRARDALNDLNEEIVDRNEHDDNPEDAEFVHELPADSSIPKDWTIFPIEKAQEPDYEYNLITNRDSRLRSRLRINVVKNGRIIPNDTFKKYTR